MAFKTTENLQHKSRCLTPELAGGLDERDNGNGSLMRILPLVLHTIDLNIDERYEWTKKISSITHAHVRSVMACFYYLEFAKKIIDGNKYFRYNEIFRKFSSKI